MSILIRGMEMPICRTCPCSEEKLYGNLCRITNEIVPFSFDRGDKCPLIELPSDDVVEVKYAKDIYMQGKGHCEFKCSLCGAEIGCVEGGDMDGGKFNYCPNCGAKMKGEDDGNTD